MAQGTIKFINKDKSVFFTVLRERIDLYFKENSLSRYGNNRMVWKGIIMLGIFLVPYSLVLSNLLSAWGLLLMAVLMGIGTAGVGMAVMHDANHGSFSSIPWVNTLFCSTLYLLGGNVRNWEVQHNTLHHTYTGIHDMDEDITGKFLLRLSYGDKLKKLHRYQHIYAFLLYGLMTFSFFVKDFRMAYKYNRQAKNRIVKPFSSRDITMLISGKLFYFLIICVLPLVVTDLTIWQWLIGFFIMHFTAGLVLSTIFQLAHVVEGVQEPAFNEQGNIENAWAVHQMCTTCNFSCHSLVSWYIGGLDYQVEHHLFPSISHVHYRSISKIVRSTAESFGIPYNNKNSLGEAINSHVMMLKTLGR